MCVVGVCVCMRKFVCMGISVGVEKGVVDSKGVSVGGGVGVCVRGIQARK